MKYIILILLLFSIFFAACKNEKGDEFFDVNDITGTYKFSILEEVTYQGANTVIREESRLIKDSSTVFIFNEGNEGERLNNVHPELNKSYIWLYDKETNDVVLYFSDGIEKIGTVIYRELPGAHTQIFSYVNSIHVNDSTQTYLTYKFRKDVPR